MLEPDLSSSSSSSLSPATQVTSGYNPSSYFVSVGQARGAPSFPFTIGSPQSDLQLQEPSNHTQPKETLFQQGLSALRADHEDLLQSPVPNSTYDQEERIRKKRKTSPTTEKNSPKERRRSPGSKVDYSLQRRKYEILGAFFRVFFKLEPGALVGKNIITTLYSKKISSSLRLARNAMFRHMWNMFRDQLSSIQWNYRDYVKGMKLKTNGNHLLYEGVEKDLKVLGEAGLRTDVLYDFTEEELANSCEKLDGTSSARSSGPSTSSAEIEGSSSTPTSTSRDGLTPSFQSAVCSPLEDGSGFSTYSQFNDKPSLIAHIEHLELIAHKLVVSLQELKGKLQE